MTDTIIELDAAMAGRVIASLQDTAPWRTPLVRAVASRRIDLLELQRPGSRSGVRRAFARAAAADRPTIALIGDDDYMTSGPQGWPCATLLLCWADVVVVYAMIGEAGFYEAFVRAADKQRRIAIVETSSAEAQAWADAVPPGRRILKLLPLVGPHSIERAVQ